MKIALKILTVLLLLAMSTGLTCATFWAVYHHFDATAFFFGITTLGTIFMTVMYLFFHLGEG